MISNVIHLHNANHGENFHAVSLRDVHMDPILGVDHAWMSGPTFPAHPHAGFSAVSYLFLDSETGIMNKDSLGNCNVIQPGGIHWTTAGSGIVHEEYPNERSKTVHMLQIFVNLPQTLQLEPPFTLGLEPENVPVVSLSCAQIRVPLGSFRGVKSPLTLPTEITLLDIMLDNNGVLDIPISANEIAFIIPIFGDLSIDDQSFRHNDLNVPFFQASETDYTIRLQAKHQNTRVVMFSGKPLKQPVYWCGSLALASKEALSLAVSAYKRGEFGYL